MTDGNVGGFIPDKNGFIEGYGICSYSELSAGTGMAFRIYRDGEATDCVLMITDADNDGFGAVRARLFNTHPAPRLVNAEDVDLQTFHYRAQERITARAEAPTQQGIAMSADLKKFMVFIFPVSDVVTSETLSAQRFAGGNVGGVPGGGEGGDAGEDPIIVV